MQYLVRQFKSVVIDEEGTILIAMNVVEIQHKNITVAIKTQKVKLEGVEILSRRMRKYEAMMGAEREQHRKTK